MISGLPSVLENRKDFFTIPVVDDSAIQPFDSLTKGILGTLTTWILSSSSPTFNLKGEDTLTVGDQTRWFKAKSLLASARLSEREFGWVGDRELGEIMLRYNALPVVIPRISYRNPEVVQAYLVAHPEIEDFLLAAWPILVQYFGEEVDIILEVISYPEVEANEELIAWIQSTDDVYKGLEKLETFKDEWFFDHMEEVDDKLNFNIENK